MNFEHARQFDPVTFTELAPRLLNVSSAELLAAVKRALLAALLEEPSDAFPESLGIGAINDAEALASLTPFPVLFLPVLAEEKVAAADTSKFFYYRGEAFAHALLANPFHPDFMGHITMAEMIAPILTGKEKTYPE